MFLRLHEQLCGYRQQLAVAREEYDHMKSLDLRVLIRRQSILALVSSLVVAAMLLYELLGVENPRLPVIWVTVLVVISLIRIVLTTFSGNSDWVHGWLLDLFRVAAGLTWGFGALFFLDQTSPVVQSVILTGISGVLAGSNLIYGTTLRSYIYFAAPLLVPLFYWALTNDAGSHVVIGWLALAYFISGVVAVMRNEGLFSGAVALIKQHELDVVNAVDYASKLSWQQRTLEFQSDMLRHIAKHDVPLSDVFELAIAFVEKINGNTTCSMLLLDDSGTQCIASFGSLLPESYSQALIGAKIGPSAGSCGTAAFRKERVIVADILTDPLWETHRQMGVLPAEQRACWSQPILASDGRALGTFAMYYPEIREPGDEEIALLEAVADLAAIAIEQNQKDKRIANHARRLEQIFETIPDAVGVHKDNKWVYCNTEAVRIFGAANKEELMGTPVLERVHPDDRAMVIDRIRKQQMGQTVPLTEECLVKVDGTFFPGEVQARAFKFGEEPALLAMMRDMSHQKKIESNLRLLQKVIDNSIECIMILDRSGKVEYANPSSCKLHGFSEDQLIELNILDLWRQNCSQFDKEQFDRHLLNGRRWASDCSRDGDEDMIISRTITPVHSAGEEVSNFICVERDVTQERQNQRQDGHAQRLEGLGVLAGGIAHDFNNILNIITGNVWLALRRAENKEIIQEYMQIINDAAQRASELCNQMLTYSGEGAVVTAPLNLTNEINSIVDLVTVSINKKSRIKLNLARNLPQIKADKTQVQQIVMNLVINANDAIGDKPGVIELTSGVMEITSHLARSAIQCNPDLKGISSVFLKVTDNGCGMDMTTSNKVFDPFFTTKFTGRGLGMSAVLGIIRSHNGAIWVNSMPGVGTTFTIAFPPLSEPVDMTVSASLSQSADGGEGLVLIVDDEPIIGEMAVAMLESVGYQTLLASDGEMAVSLFRDRHKDIDLVLLDWAMPRMDGEEAFRQMRSIDPEAKVIICTGYAASDIMDRLSEMCANAVITKPYLPDSFLEKVSMVIGQQKALSIY